MLVHVQRQQRHAAGQRVRVVGRPLVDQRALARLEHQQHPARAATQRLAHRDELVAPALDAAEVGLQRQLHGRLHRLAVTAQAGEVQLVQQHRVGGDQLFALQAVELEARHASANGVGGELRANGVEPLHGAAVVVLVVAARSAWPTGRAGRRLERQGLNQASMRRLLQRHEGIQQRDRQARGGTARQQRHHADLEAKQRHRGRRPRSAPTARRSARRSPCGHSTC